ncbi:hypothetical protein GGF32_008345 [Allomyces javanicus]|nr:hypothetical protein GGF32_008345 [Allomyces javanicus]
MMAHSPTATWTTADSSAPTAIFTFPSPGFHLSPTTTPGPSRTTSPVFLAPAPPARPRSSMSSMSTTGSISGSSPGENIKVVVRFRPQNARERAEGGVPIVHVDSAGKRVEVQSQAARGKPVEFSFDRVFTENETQATLYEYAVKETVNDVLNGYNGTVFAYGQTGSGKTYTMMGLSLNDDVHKGMIPRIAEHLFQCIQQAPETVRHTVQVSVMELYNEKIRDLLNPESGHLRLRGGGDGSPVHVENLLEVDVSSAAEILEVLHRGSSRRAVASTLMNAVSSRSHSIVILKVHQQDLATGTTLTGQLSLVDLAGSEKVGKTGATGQTFEEGKQINLSLTTLGNVINALTDGRRKHIPYRDSKLTRILQESLGGNSRTTLIINASPSSFNEAETLSTLRFATRAKSIQNKATVNAELSAAELKRLLEQSEAQNVTFKEYIAALEREVLQARRRGSNASSLLTDDSLEELKLRERHLNEQLEGKHRELAVARMRVAELENSVAELADLVADLERQLAAERARKDSVAAEITLAEYDAARAEITRLREELAAVEALDRSHLEAGRFVTQTLAEEIKALQDRDADRDRQSAMDQAELAAVQDMLDRERATHRAEVQMLEDARRELEARNVDLRETMDAHQQAAQFVADELAATKAKVRATDRARRHHANEQARLEAEQTRLQTELAASQDRVRELEARAAELERAMVDETKRAHQEERHLTSALYGELVSVKRRLVDLVDRNKVLTAMVHDFIFHVESSGGNAVQILEATGSLMSQLVAWGRMEWFGGNNAVTPTTPAATAAAAAAAAAAVTGRRASIASNHSRTSRTTGHSTGSRSSVAAIALTPPGSRTSVHV